MLMAVQECNVLPFLFEILARGAEVPGDLPNYAKGALKCLVSCTRVITDELRKEAGARQLEIMKGLRYKIKDQAIRKDLKKVAHALTKALEGTGDNH
mmetsp:Transcript_38072/g.28052  ORF Transcript_38072/g.28052 Transcript_38072/m.28052 type:complete len:97 (+) Transcript_38072:879-1169(+)